MRYLLLLLLLCAPVAAGEPEVSDYLPTLEPWKLVKGGEDSAMRGSEVPRVPDLQYTASVAANLHGTLATGLVDGDLLLLADGEGVHALRQETGERLWSVSIYESFKGRFVEAYGLNERVFVVTSRTPGGGGRSFLLALSRETGRVLWKKEVGDKPTSNLLITGNRVCFGTVHTDGRVMCYTPAGDLAWSARVGGNVRGLAADGDALYVSTEGGEESRRLYAFSLGDGRLLWSYSHRNIVKSPLVAGGRVFFVDSAGNVVALSREGRLLWKRNLGAGSDVNGHSLLAAGKGELYVARTLGERPLSLHVLDFDGRALGNFTLGDGEEPGIPVVAGRVVLLPVRGKDYGRVYFLWRGTVELHRVTYPGDEVFVPRVSAARGAAFAVFSRDRDRQVVLRLGDGEAPDIRELADIREAYGGEEVEVRAVLGDSRSAVHRALLFYRVNGSEWRAVEMTPERRYVVEPVGGYGLEPEPFAARIPPQQAGSVVEYMVVAIDGVGNLASSEVMRYEVTAPPVPEAKEEEESPPEERGVCGPTAVALIALLALLLYRRHPAARV
ncbi:MAG: PQQ-binding-like beta-propeller repeat protein [Euryarchaeota archaeon]|nr:PQQ-binding-like beta-propeller repeat protein [Euryarchaeota archaeon]